MITAMNKNMSNIFYILEFIKMLYKKKIKRSPLEDTLTLYSENR